MVFFRVLVRVRAECCKSDTIEGKYNLSLEFMFLIFQKQEAEEPFESRTFVGHQSSLMILKNVTFSAQLLFLK